MNVSNRISANFGKATIQRDSASLFDDMAVSLKNNPIRTFKIVGHTDSTGDPALNLKLSRQRADPVKSALVEGRATNRRVELTRTDR